MNSTTYSCAHGISLGSSCSACGTAGTPYVPIVPSGPVSVVPLWDPSLERIANTLDDYMEMSLAGIELSNGLRSLDPEMVALLKPLTDTLKTIRERRAAR